jgi:molecular chaperone GrpE
MSREGQEETPTGAQEAQGAEIAALSQRLQELEQQNLRLLADFENQRRRQRRDEEEQRLRAQQDAASLLLPLADDLELALGAAPQDDPMRAGVALVHGKLMQALGRLGLEPIAAAGQPFDPALHEAIGQEESDLPPGTVATEVRTGYRIQDRVVRPALVRVAKARE